MPKHSKSSDGFGPDQICQYYRERFMREGDTPKAFWGSKESQQIRFETLCEIGCLENKSVLDVGCGSGGLVRFFYAHAIRSQSYLGIDFNDEAIEVAQNAFGLIDPMRYSFCCCDFMDIHFPLSIAHPPRGGETFDTGSVGTQEISRNTFISFAYVIASGLFALEEPEWWDNTLAKLQKMYDLCTKGVAINFLSINAPCHIPGSHYTAPSLMLHRILDRITKKVTLRHDYLHNDFTVYMYR